MIEKVRLGDYTLIKTGKLDANASSEDGAYPFFTCSKDALKINSYSYDCECVLVAGNGDLNAKYYKGKFDAYQRTYIVESKDSEKLSVRYLYRFLDGYVEVLRQQAIGGVIKYIKLGNLTDAIIPLPPLYEQERIADLFDEYEVVLTNRQKAMRNLDDLVKSRFVEMFGDIKDTCEVGYYIGSLTAGKSLAGEVECENKVLKTGAASFDYFDATQVKNLPLDYEPQAEHLVKPGDIIISRMNTAELTGATAYVWDVQDNVYLPDRLWKANLKEDCNPIFVWQMLIQPSTKEQIRRECSGTSGSMKNISKPGMLAIKVKKVSFELQNQFAEFVKQTDKSKYCVKNDLLRCLLRQVLNKSYRR